MKIFISWSGENSRIIAEALSWFLQRVNNLIKPWISSESLEPGVRWTDDLGTKLNDTHFGIICLTPDNLDKPWIHFEAGAVSKIKNISRIIPYLYEVKPTDIIGPLSQFQAIKVDKTDTKKMIDTISFYCSNVGENPPTQEVIDDSFNKWWEDYWEKLSKINPSSTIEKPKRSIENVVEEILQLQRNSINRNNPDNERSMLSYVLLQQMYIYYRQALFASGLLEKDFPMMLPLDFVEKNYKSLFDRSFREPSLIPFEVSFDIFANYLKYLSKK
jgi:hypothetical protein